MILPTRPINRRIEANEETSVPDEFVPFVSDEIDYGSLLSDTEEIATEFDTNELEEEQSKRFRSSLTENGGVELTLESSDDGGEEDVRRQGHDCGS